MDGYPVPEKRATRVRSLTPALALQLQRQQRALRRCSPARTNDSNVYFAAVRATATCTSLLFVGPPERQLTRDMSARRPCRVRSRRGSRDPGGHCRSYPECPTATAALSSGYCVREAHSD